MKVPTYKQLAGHTLLCSDDEEGRDVSLQFSKAAQVEEIWLGFELMLGTSFVEFNTRNHFIRKERG
jgi:hypothetical protein